MTPWPRTDATRFAVSASGVELGEAALAWIGEDYRPEPEVMLIDADHEPRQRLPCEAVIELRAAAACR